MVQKTLNPTFRHVDWSACGPGLTRQDRLILRVWVKGWTAESWKQLLELKIFLTELQYLGKTVCYSLPIVSSATLTMTARGDRPSALSERRSIPSNRWHLRSFHRLNLGLEELLTWSLTTVPASLISAHITHLLL